MNKPQIKKKFHSITVWKRGAERAPHKPLLILYALAKVQRGEGRKVYYRDVDSDLRGLLKDFGPPRQSLHPEYPFWRLQNDGIWEIEGAEELVVRESNTDAKKSELIEHNVPAGFTSEVYQALKGDRELLREIALDILENHFPDSLHEDILSAVGMDLAATIAGQARRDPSFRPRVLTAYEHRCAVCGFDLRLGESTIALDAAHVKWHQAGGPDDENNGLALCTLHHKTFDRGAYTVRPDHRVEVSEHAYGGSGFREWLLRYHGQLLREPINPQYAASKQFLAWHRREVFHGPARQPAGSAEDR